MYTNAAKYVATELTKLICKLKKYRIITKKQKQDSFKIVDFKIHNTIRFETKSDFGILSSFNKYDLKHSVTTDELI